MSKAKMYARPVSTGSRCPSCGVVARSHFSGDPEPPRPGDLTLCHDCYFLGVYDERLRARPMTAEETARLQGSPEILSFLAKLHQQKEKLS
jgi:hypothetical protein